MGLSLAALAGAVVSMLQAVGKAVLSVLIFFAVLLIVWPLLPSDPFRAAIQQWGAQMAIYYEWIDYFVPVGFIVALTAFWAAWRYAFWVYRKATNVVLGQDTANHLDV